MGVFCNRAVDFQGQSQGFAGGLRGNAGRRAGSDGVEKVFELEAQGFGSGEIGFIEGEAGGGVRRCTWSRGGA